MNDRIIENNKWLHKYLGSLKPKKAKRETRKSCSRMKVFFLPWYYGIKTIKVWNLTGNNRISIKSVQSQNLINEQINWLQRLHNTISCSCNKNFKKFFACQESSRKFMASSGKKWVRIRLLRTQNELHFVTDLTYIWQQRKS